MFQLLLLLYSFSVRVIISDKLIEIRNCCYNNASKTLYGGLVQCQIDKHVEGQMPKIYSNSIVNFLSDEMIKSVLRWNFTQLQCHGDKEIVHYQYSEGDPDFVVTDAGHLWLIHENIFITSDDYCFDNRSGSVLFCEKKSDQEKATSVKICCGSNDVFRLESNTCQSPNVTNEHKKSLFGRYFENDSNLSIGFPKCLQPNESYVVIGKLNDANFSNEFRHISWSKTDLNISSDKICLEVIGDSIEIISCLENRFSVQLVTKSAIYYVYPICLILSSIFLLITLCICYFLLVNGHNMLHWNCQTSYVLCLFIGDIILAANQLAMFSLVNKTLMCSIIASSMLFFFLSAFFWLNTMCFNIWWTFRDMRPTNLEKSQEVLRCRLCQLYAWGVPFLIIVSGFILDTFPHLPEYLRPQFGDKTYWFHGHTEVITYFFAPIGFIFSINLVLFLITARELSCGLWKADNVKFSSEKVSMSRIGTKLLVVMGISWIFEVISWLAGGRQEIWYLTDLVNALQGLFIFIVIGCQPQAWTAATNKYPCVDTLTAILCRRKRRGANFGQSATYQGHTTSYGGTETTNNVTTTTKNVNVETTC